MAYEVLSAIYCLIAVAFLVPTYREGKQKALPWNAARIIGLISCLFWPVLLAVTLAVVYWRNEWSTPNAGV